MALTIQNKTKESYKWMLPWLTISFLEKVIKGIRMNTHTYSCPCMGLDCRLQATYPSELRTFN